MSVFLIPVVIEIFFLQLPQFYTHQLSTRWLSRTQGQTNLQYIHFSYHYRLKSHGFLPGLEPRTASVENTRRTPCISRLFRTIIRNGKRNCIVENSRIDGNFIAVHIIIQQIIKRNRPNTACSNIVTEIQPVNGRADLVTITNNIQHN